MLRGRVCSSNTVILLWRLQAIMLCGIELQIHTSSGGLGMIPWAAAAWRYPTWFAGSPWNGTNSQPQWPAFLGFLGKDSDHGLTSAVFGPRAPWLLYHQHPHFGTLWNSQICHCAIEFPTPGAPEHHCPGAHDLWAFNNILRVYFSTFLLLLLT